MCEAVKPRYDFYPHSKAKNGVHSECRQCTNKAAKKFQQCQNEKARAAQRKSKLKRNWGLTLEEFDQMLAAQRGVCAICSSGVPGGTGRFHVDHDHATGIIRGLLCSACNTGIGQLKERIDVLERAIDYLKNGGVHGERS